MAFGTGFPGVKVVDVPELALAIPTMDRPCDHARQSSDTFRLFFATSFLNSVTPWWGPETLRFDPAYSVPRLRCFLPETFCQKKRREPGHRTKNQRSKSGWVGVG